MQFICKKMLCFALKLLYLIHLSEVFVDVCCFDIILFIDFFVIFIYMIFSYFLRILFWLFCLYFFELSFFVKKSAKNAYILITLQILHYDFASGVIYAMIFTVFAYYISQKYERCFYYCQKCVFLFAKCLVCCT